MKKSPVSESTTVDDLKVILADSGAKLDTAVTALWVIGENLCQPDEKSKIAREALSSIMPIYQHEFPKRKLLYDEHD